MSKLTFKVQKSNLVIIAILFLKIYFYFKPASQFLTGSVNTENCSVNSETATLIEYSHHLQLISDFIWQNSLSKGLNNHYNLDEVLKKR